MLSELEAGTLSPEDHARLEELLGTSRQARREYFRYFELSAILHQEAGMEREEGVLPTLQSDWASRRMVQRSLMAAAAILILVAALMTLLKLRAPTPEAIALEATPGALWSVRSGSGEEESQGRGFEAGTVLVVSTGVVSAESAAGTQVLVQGPARVKVLGLRHFELEEGWLWVDAKADQESVRIEVGPYVVRDIGTRFGVRHVPDEGIEVHVFEGEVEVSNQKGERVSLLRPKRIAFRLDAESALVPIPLGSDPFPGIEDLLDAPASYRTVIRGQHPAAYWQLDESEPGPIRNVVSGEDHGTAEPDARMGQPGVRPADGFGGFNDKNLGVRLPGSSVRSLLRGMDGPNGVSLREGAASFWIRRDADMTQGEILWHAGETSSGGFGPELEMQAFLSADGRLGFFIENGRHDVLLKSPRSYADGDWHHVAVSWNSQQVSLYADGLLAAIDTLPRRDDSNVFRGIEVRFGKPGIVAHKDGGKPDLQSFHGWVDEVALWDRGLAPAEISAQFRAARPAVPAPD
ncbi:hypothetical protein HAHE_07970 [Haloferula helveola]|uniref:Laminin G domain-containing protein n=1 Tax=Haloferula helveola TaxID=490095 RepID=A0ABN6H2U5_9BACT|nr:hypothetical protein HAHE_07970 [Haloferula helveola]